MTVRRQHQPHFWRAGFGRQCEVVKPMPGDALEQLTIHSDGSFTPLADFCVAASLGQRSATPALRRGGKG